MLSISWLKKGLRFGGMSFKTISDQARLLILIPRTVRTAKVSRMQETYDAAYGSGKVKIIGIDDLVSGDFTEALKGFQTPF